MDDVRPQPTEPSPDVQPGWAVGLTHPGAVPPQEAVIFDLDGVVTDTAPVHAAAWKRLFDEVLQHVKPTGSGAVTAPFDAESDYLLYVDGRPREDGVLAFLAAGGIPVPPGEVGDPPGTWSVHGLAAKKDQIFVDLLGAGGVRPFPGTVDLLRRLKAGRVPTALVSSSRHAVELLTAAGLDDLFDVVVDGKRAAERHLPGKPDPATFLAASQDLRVGPTRTAVIEDATAGVTAARRGGYGLVVGVARHGQHEHLRAAGADVVVDDVAQLDLGALRLDPWLLVHQGFDPAHEGHREALTTLANGYLGTRGAAPESSADGVHYPGTYLAGVYNRATAEIEGQGVESEHLVNAPNWLPLDVRIEQGPWWSAGGLTVTGERRELDLKRGLLTRTATLNDAQGRQLRLAQRRLVSLAAPHLAALETTLEPVGWQGIVEVKAGVDPLVRNTNVAEDASLADRHLRTVHREVVEGGALLVEVETTGSHIRIATACRLTASPEGAAAPPSVVQEEDQPRHVVTLALRDGQVAIVDKTAAVFTSRDPAITSPGLAALAAVDEAPGGLTDLLPGHTRRWEEVWNRFGVDLDADLQTRLVLNLHLFHLLQSLSEHTASLDAGCRLAACTVSGTAGTCSGTSCSSFRCLPPTSRRSAAACWSTGTGASTRRGRRPGGWDFVAPSFPGRAAATVATRRLRCCSTPGPVGGCRTTRGASTTSGLRWLTTRGGTTTPPGTGPGSQSGGRI